MPQKLQGMTDLAVSSKTHNCRYERRITDEQMTVELVGTDSFRMGIIERIFDDFCLGNFGKGLTGRSCDSGFRQFLALLRAGAWFHYGHILRILFFVR